MSSAAVGHGEAHAPTIVGVVQGGGGSTEASSPAIVARGCGRADWRNASSARPRCGADRSRRRRRRTRPVVVIDPGHDLRANLATEPIGPGSSTRKIKDGGGTHGVVSGTTEAELNLAVSLRLRALLEGAGIRVVMTRSRTAGTSVGNVARAGIANRAGAALFVRIHADGASSSGARGTHTLYPALRDGWTDDIYRQSRAAARIVQQQLLRSSRISRSGAPGALGSHGLQLGRRPGDPRRGRVHDQPGRGQGTRHRHLSGPGRTRALPRRAAVPRPLGRTLLTAFVTGRRQVDR